MSDLPTIEHLPQLDRVKFREIWENLTVSQRKLVIVMPDYATKKEAAEAVGLSPGTAYNLNGKLQEAVDLLIKSREYAAYTILSQAVAKAAQIKVEGLDEKDPRIKQAVATEILERFMGKPSISMELDATDKALEMLKRLNAI